MVEAIDFGPVPVSYDHLQRLQAFVHARHQLIKAGYSLEQFSQAALDKKRRCKKCSKVVKKSDATRQSQTKTATPPQTVTPAPAEIQGGQSEVPQMQKNLTLNSDQAAACKFHSGKVAFKKWTCCNNPPFSKPCSSRTYHTTRHYSPGELEESWALFMTPPSYSPQSAAAVVIDCEMGVARSGESELIRVSLIDYFSREVLLDSLVWPSVKMAHYNTRFSGVHRAMLENARQHCKCLFGRDEARRAILKFIDPDTIVIAHAGHQDLASLRWIHTAIIDTLIVEESRRQQKGPSLPGQPGSAAKKQASRLSLKSLAHQRLGRSIQCKRRGHDSVEDALATRDLLYWHILQGVKAPKGAT